MYVTYTESNFQIDEFLLSCLNLFILSPSPIHFSYSFPLKCKINDIRLNDIYILAPTPLRDSFYIQKLWSKSSILATPPPM